MMRKKQMLGLKNGDPCSKIWNITDKLTKKNVISLFYTFYSFYS